MYLNVLATSFLDEYEINIIDWTDVCLLSASSLRAIILQTKY